MKLRTSNTIWKCQNILNKTFLFLIIKIFSKDRHRHNDINPIAVYEQEFQEPEARIEKQNKVQKKMHSNTGVMISHMQFMSEQTILIIESQTRSSSTNTNGFITNSKVVPKITKTEIEKTET